MNVRRFETSDAQSTRRVGEDLGATLQAGDLITLSGPLGAGKTTFVQGLARGLGCDTAVTSPTFVLMIEHEGRLPLVHIDAYRLESLCYDAIRDAGVIDAVERDDAVTVIEWPERIADFLPTPRFRVTFAPGEGDARTIEIESR